MEIEKKYDIGLVCVTNLNIGNNLTNYALYQYLSDLNYNVLLIGNPLNMSVDVPNNMDSRFRLFQHRPYPECHVLPPVEDKWGLSFSNQICDRFVLGSDQLWRAMFVEDTDFFTCLDWVESSKPKIAYATSLGVDYFEGDANMQRMMGYLLKRFQNISVREQGSVRLLRELYGIETEWVLDPVFLCEKKHYESMAGKGKLCMPNTKYTGAYILDITEDKESALLSIAYSFTGGMYKAITQPGSVVDSKRSVQFLSDTTIEEWIGTVKDCKFFLTDSFHGVCFALIFQKQFCVIFDKKNWRGFERIRSLLNLLHLNSRFVEKGDSEKILDLYSEKIDYSKVNAILSEKCEKSKRWLKFSLEKEGHEQEQYGIYDFSWRMNGRLQQKLYALQKELHSVKEELNLAKEEQRLQSYKTRNDLFLHIHRNQETGALLQIVGWGAGECFKRNISRIQKFYHMKYICDSDQTKWGKELDEHTVCISPAMLSEMHCIMVIIMVDSASDAFQIAEELSRMGITTFEQVENWLSYVECAKTS